MYIDKHGGECCGIHHIHEFWQQTEEGVKELKRKLDCFVERYYDYEEVQVNGFESKNAGDGWNDEYIPTKKKFSCILEATLTDDQMKFWAPHMKEAGFKIVNRFLNSNSGNVVNVLHYNPAGRRKIEKAPYRW